MKRRNYGAERRAAAKWADHTMDCEPKGFALGAWTHNWGLVFNAYLAGLRKKSPPQSDRGEKHG